MVSKIWVGMATTNIHFNWNIVFNCTNADFVINTSMQWLLRTKILQITLAILPFYQKNMQIELPSWLLWSVYYSLCNHKMHFKIVHCNAKSLVLVDLSVLLCTTHLSALTDKLSSTCSNIWSCLIGSNLVRTTYGELEIGLYSELKKERKNLCMWLSIPKIKWVFICIWELHFEGASEYLLILPVSWDI